MRPGVDSHLEDMYMLCFRRRQRSFGDGLLQTVAKHMCMRMRAHREGSTRARAIEDFSRLLKVRSNAKQSRVFPQLPPHHVGVCACVEGYPSTSQQVSNEARITKSSLEYLLHRISSTAVSVPC